MLRTRIRAGTAAGIVLSVVFSALFTLIFSCDLLAPPIRIGEPTPYTIRVPFMPHVVDPAAGASAGTVRYEHRRVLLPRGTVLRGDTADARIAMSFEATRRPVPPLRILGVGLIYLTLSLLLATYARRFGPGSAKLLRTQIGMFVLMLVMLAVAKAVLIFTAIPEYWIAVSTVPLWACLYLDRRTAFLLNVVLAFFVSSLLRFDIILLAVFLMRGMASSLAFWNKKRPRQMLLAGTVAGVAAALLFTATMMVFDGTYDVGADLQKLGGSSLLACLGGGVVAGVVAYLLREPAERLLGAVGRDRLLDLTDLEQPLLQRMAREAPGSWEHCRAMANLAEAASAAIGADALLTRCGAYYHDLGKTIQPKYFVENLAPGERSPHEDLEPDVSADAIMAHVVEGTRILRAGRVPEPVVEFAYTHHGTQVVEYFWHKCLEQGNPKGLTEDNFRYPGMKPRTKETSILMLVDSIEAASRTIQPPDRKKFEEMIQRVIFTKLRAGQLDDAGLSTFDLRMLVTRMTETLVNMYHGRIKYPWQREREEEAARTPAPPVSSSPGHSGSMGGTAGTAAAGGNVVTGGNVVRLPRPGEKA